MFYRLSTTGTNTYFPFLVSSEYRFLLVAYILIVRKNNRESFCDLRFSVCCFNTFFSLTELHVKQFKSCVHASKSDKVTDHYSLSLYFMQKLRMTP